MALFNNFIGCYMKIYTENGFEKYAFFYFKIANIDLTVPAGMEYTSLRSNVYTNYSYVHSLWIPGQNQVGFHLVCAIAKDPLG